MGCEITWPRSAQCRHQADHAWPEAQHIVDDVDVLIGRAPTLMPWQAYGRPRGLSLRAGARLVPKAACAGSAAPRMAAGRGVLAFGPSASGLPVCWLLATARRGRAVRHGWQPLRKLQMCAEGWRRLRAISSECPLQRCAPCQAAGSLRSSVSALFLDRQRLGQGRAVNWRPDPC